MTDFTDEKFRRPGNSLKKINDNNVDPATHRMVGLNLATIIRDKFNIKGRGGWTIKDGRPEQILTPGQIKAKAEKQNNQRFLESR